MQLEWKYCFESGEEARTFLQGLIEQREQGRFLGSSYPGGHCHSCFTKEQRDSVGKLAAGIRGLNFERALVFRGNLFPRDFGMRTFAQPFVQWCPSPIYSTRFSQWVPPSEPWGTSMEGELIFGNELSSVIENSIVGLEPCRNQSVSEFDVYRASFAVEIAHECSESAPLTLDCSKMPHADIVRLQSGVLLCSSRFARVLSASWDGSKDAKFQPVECLGVSESLKSRNLAKIRISPPPDDKALSDSLALIEELLGVSLPEDYKTWALDNRGRLPSGWLSPIGGKESEIVVHTRQEREESDPPMPGNLVPLFAFGDGDYICVEAKRSGYVRWMHEVGKYETGIGECIRDLVEAETE